MGNASGKHKSILSRAKKSGFLTGAVILLPQGGKIREEEDRERKRKTGKKRERKTGRCERAGSIGARDCIGRGEGGRRCSWYVGQVGGPEDEARLSRLAGGVEREVER